MELKDTIELMQSADWKERFKAEYLQCVIRLKKLVDYIHDLEDSTKPMNYASEKLLLGAQYGYMVSYIHVLEEQSYWLGIELPKYENVEIHETKHV